MHPVRTAVTLTLIFCMTAGTVRADVIGGAPAAPTDTRAVARQIESLGVAPPVALQSAAALAPEDAAYFGDHPERVQLVGTQEVQSLWYESVLGGVFVVAVAALVVGIIVHNRDT